MDKLVFLAIIHFSVVHFSKKNKHKEDNSQVKITRQNKLGYQTRLGGNSNLVIDKAQHIRKQTLFSTRANDAKNYLQ